MRTITVYESLKEYRDAYNSGETRKYLVLDFTEGSYYLSGGEDDESCIDLGQPIKLDDVLGEAFNMLGITVHLT